MKSEDTLNAIKSVLDKIGKTGYGNGITPVEAREIILDILASENKDLLQ